jgi:hypothetical protein
VNLLVPQKDGNSLAGEQIEASELGCGSVICELLRWLL